MKNLLKTILIVLMLAQLTIPTWAGFGIKGGSKSQNLAVGLTWMHSLNPTWGLEAGAEYISSNPSIANGFIYGKYLLTSLARMPFSIKLGLDLFSGLGSSSSAVFGGVEFGNLFDNYRMGLELGANFSSTSALSAQIFYLF